MTKTEIIRSIAYAGTKDGDRLVEQELPGFDLVISQMGGESGGSACRILMAEAFESILLQQTEDLSEVPDSKLFRRLHSTALEFHQEIIQVTIIDAAAQGTAEEHRKIVERLRQFSQKLGIQYDEPTGSLWYPNAE